MLIAGVLNKAVRLGEALDAQGAVSRAWLGSYGISAG